MDHSIARYIRSIKDEELREKAEELYLAFQVAGFTRVFPGLLGLTIAVLVSALLFVLGADGFVVAIFSVVVPLATIVVVHDSKRYAVRKKQDAQRVIALLRASPALGEVLTEFRKRDAWVDRSWESLTAA